MDISKAIDLQSAWRRIKSNHHDNHDVELLDIYFYELLQEKMGENDAINSK